MELLRQRAELARMTAPPQPPRLEAPAKPQEAPIPPSMYVNLFLIIVL